VDHPSDVVWVTAEDVTLLEGAKWHPAPLPISKGGNTSSSPTTSSNPAEALKHQGNTLYLRGSWVDALHTYIRGLAALKDLRTGSSDSRSTPESDDLCKLEIDLLNNVAAAGLALKIPEGAALAAAYAGKAARLATGSGDKQRAQKALLREGKALLAMQRYGSKQTCVPHCAPLMALASSTMPSIVRKLAFACSPYYTPPAAHVPTNMQSCVWLDTVLNSQVL
jgi:hypothetical protein